MDTAATMADPGPEPHPDPYGPLRPYTDETHRAAARLLADAMRRAILHVMETPGVSQEELWKCELYTRAARTLYRKAAGEMTIGECVPWCYVEGTRTHLTDVLIDKDPFVFDKARTGSITDLMLVENMADRIIRDRNIFG